MRGTMSIEPGASVVCSRTLRVADQRVPPFTPMTVVRVEGSKIIAKLSDGTVCRIPESDLNVLHDAAGDTQTVSPTQGAAARPATQAKPQAAHTDQQQTDFVFEWKLAMVFVLVGVPLWALAPGTRPMQTKLYEDPLFWWFIGWGIVSAWNLGRASAESASEKPPEWFKTTCVVFIVLGALSALSLLGQGRLF